jgi:hypothetical protein
VGASFTSDGMLSMEAIARSPWPDEDVPRLQPVRRTPKRGMRTITENNLAKRDNFKPDTSSNQGMQGLYGPPGWQQSAISLMPL